MTKSPMEELQKQNCELQQQVNAQRVRILKLQEFVGEVLKLERYNWLHPDPLADLEGEELVRKIICQAWELIGYKTGEPQSKGASKCEQ